MPKTSETGIEIPVYGEKPKLEGMYLALFHGRESPDEQMDDWGFNGPLIGPIIWCHTTYATDIKIAFVSHDEEKKYFDTADHPDGHVIPIVDDLIFFAGSYYGDWTVFNVEADDVSPPSDTFRRVMRRNYWSRKHHSMCDGER